MKFDDLSFSKQLLLCGFYADEYQPNEIVKMLGEAKIKETKHKFVLKWDNGAKDIFYKVKVKFGDSFVEVLKFEKDRWK